MTFDWQRCIITTFDMIGITRLAEKGLGSSLMLQMHQFAVQKINQSLPNHAHGYIWNDSIQLLSYHCMDSKNRKEAINELSEFKEALDTHCGLTYAISVMGQTFPQNEFLAPVYNGSIGQQPRATILKTSSWAMANTFNIETKLKSHRADWYIDSRITKNLDLPEPFKSEQLKLLPKNELRTINLYKGYFHNM